MNFSSTACDKFVRIFSFAVFTTLLLVFVLSCAAPMQQKQISPAAVKEFEREVVLPSVKPVAPESKSSSGHTTSQEIETHDNSQIDSTIIEKE
jgi:hypothetical protein